MTEAASRRDLDDSRAANKDKARTISGRLNRIFRGMVRRLYWLCWLVVLGLLGWGLATEARTSYLQAHYFTRLDRQISYNLAPGPSPSIRFPGPGPYDVRLGYADLPTIITSLTAHQLQISQQARWSPRLDWFVDHGGYTLYTPKQQTGLQMFDRSGVTLFSARYPQRFYQQFSEVPPVVANSLMFIEDRDLLETTEPKRDPAVEWSRFMLAAGARIAGTINHRWQRGGASTLATQIVKFRDSPGGRTDSIGEKMRQMVTAAAAAYQGGPDTLPARKNILVTYLNSTPLASYPGYGEVIGLPEAMWIWYGADFSAAGNLLMSPATDPATLAAQGQAYREMLSLLLAGRRPAYYLLQNRAALEALTDYYVRQLGRAGIISPALRDATLASRLPFRDDMPPPAPVSFVDNKATGWMQAELLSLLHVPNTWSLDRFDLTARTSLDEAAQQRVIAVLTRLSDPAYDQSLGLVGKYMLAGATPKPALINWSFVLYERGADANYVRIHADSLDAPFDINSGAMLQLGSTSKLRTLTTYLDIITSLNRSLAPLSTADLAHLGTTAPDALTRWAATYLATAKDRSLRPMLEAAMQRTYSASPVTFFTGGGDNSFGNFEPWEDSTVPTVEFAFENSINCAFIRLMRDIRDYEIAAAGIDEKYLLSHPDDPARLPYLERFIHTEGLHYLYHFYDEDRGLTPLQALDRLTTHTSPMASHLAVLYLAIFPQASEASMTDFLRQHMPRQSFAEVAPDRLTKLYQQFAGNKFSLNDEAYVAGLHPLRIWLTAYLQTHPNAGWNEIAAASPQAIDQSYTWLFRRGKTFQQNVRIQTIIEQDAFARIWQDWRRQGYPFDHLVPSLGTTLGASGDRPDALATLMGIILNGGVRQPTVDFDRLNFADGTPYQTDFTSKPDPKPVLDPAVADIERQALMGVVQNGTAKLLAGSYHLADGKPMQIGGKTGSGDNRFHIYGPGGALRGERVVDRTATFVFFLGNQYFGTVTAYVPGPHAAGFSFTSAMAAQLLKALQPQLDPLLGVPVPTAPPPKAVVQSGPAD
ncbi:MAG TPA: transglycosylase domain-containing protein [Acidocella sp.]|jgi:membrane peptidoglycan carboxypeptidase|nr:transglycosylase domain-containing protein [Acidocella sp.]